MDFFNVTNISSTIPIIGELVERISILINIFIALGGLVIIFIIFNIWRFISSRKQRKLLEEIQQDIKKLKRKLRYSQHKL